MTLSFWRLMRGNGRKFAELEDYRPEWRFPLVRFKDIKLKTSASYLVKGLIPREGIVVIWGPPKCGKTFWAFDISMHLALGWDYRGRRVQQGTVVYIACEGERGLTARAEAFRQRKMAEDEVDPPFHLLTTRLDLATDADALIGDIAAQIGDDGCVAIFVDTLNRSFSGSERDDKDMRAYVDAADKLRERFHCAIIIIHHCGINGERPRGHTSLTGAADAQIAVKRDRTGRVITVVEFMKDGAEGEKTISRLVVVDLGDDEDGEPITSCIVERADEEISPTSATGTGKPPCPMARKFYAAFSNAGARFAETRAESGNRPSITEAQWILELVSSGLLDPIPTEGDKATRRSAQNRQTALLSKYRRELIAADWLACNGKIIWSVRRDHS